MKQLCSNTHLYLLILPPEASAMLASVIYTHPAQPDQQNHGAAVQDGLGKLIWPKAKPLK